MNKILVGLDGSTNSFKALEEEMSLAKLSNAELHTISVEELPHFSETISEVEEEKESEDSKYNQIILRAKEMAAAKSIQIESHILAGHEVKTVIDFVKKNKIDLLVVGFLGRSAIYDWAMGSTSHSLVRLSPCSVLVVKQNPQSKKK
jgi:nucleotide-binding universal stress UspA family protein